MNPEDLRRGLPEAADLAGPLQVDTERLTRAVRRRRRTRSALTAGAVLAVAGAVFTTVGPTGPAGPAVASPGAGGAGAASAPSTDTVLGQKCGEPLKAEGVAPDIAGFSMSVSSVERVSNETGPAIDAALSAERAVGMGGSPGPALEVLYLKDGAVVGGGFTLIGRGDPPMKGTLGGQTWLLRVGEPFAMKLREQNTLCPSVTWPQIWAHPGDYEVVLTLPAAVDPKESKDRTVIARSPLTR
ncbi:hypothetical protein ACFYS8_04480 [Kitasatospora sp. NPDC004615]|uniref:hypothetical protein n=1 Tax=Kitasatospora sp. NPDC004615 TaxID=3364017 RepID=UPI00368C2C0B